MVTKFLRKSTMVVALLSLIGPASASFTADFLFSPTAGGQSLSVTNTDGGGKTLDFFRIFLDKDSTLGNYSALAWVNDQNAAGWVSNAIDPTPGFGGLPGEFNNFKFAGIADGATLGFSYGFNYGGGLAAKEQTFSYEAYFGLCDSATMNCASTLPELDPGSGIYYEGKGTGFLVYQCTPPDPACSGGSAPEPVTLSLLGTSLLGLALSRRRRTT